MLSRALVSAKSAFSQYSIGEATGGEPFEAYSSIDPKLWMNAKLKTITGDHPSPATMARHQRIESYSRGR
jgi:hypothetical protein